MTLRAHLGTLPRLTPFQGSFDLPTLGDHTTLEGLVVDSIAV